MVNPNLSQKTVDLLNLVSMAHNAARWTRYEEIVNQYGAKPVERKLEELVRRDYVEFGTHPAGGWLTEKGKAFLESLVPPAPRDPSSQPYPDGFGNHRVL